MNWHRLSDSLARSDAGYEIRISRLNDKQQTRYYNAYDPTGKHVSAGFDKEQVKRDCEAHLSKVAA